MGSLSLPVVRSRNNFLKDGQRFRFAAGSMHYWRNKPSEWKAKLQLMKDMGLNAVLTPTNWAWHEPAEQQWEFSGEKDLVKFVRTAEEVGLLVVLRLGSYATAEMVVIFSFLLSNSLVFLGGGGLMKYVENDRTSAASPFGCS